MTVGVNSLSKAADRIKLLDKVLSLFGMKVGSDMMEIDACNGRITGIKLTVYFVELGINNDKCFKNFSKTKSSLE